MGLEQMAMSGVAAVGRHRRVADALFHFTKWGNPFADERFSWPYPMYDRMRADGPVTYGRPYRQWFVFGYDEVQEVLRSPHTATAPVGELLLSTSRYRQLTPTARSNFARWLLINDAPDHTRLRAAVSRAFTPRQIDGYEPLISQAVGDLVDELDTPREIDIVEAFTTRLPIQSIAAILGLPLDRRQWLLDASREIGGMLEPLTPFDADSMSQRFAELDSYFRTVIAERRDQPGLDLISALAATDDGHDLDDDEIVAMIAFLLFAGHETVTGTLGNALVALARHPDQRTLVRGNPDLIENAVEELLRFDPPAQVSGRQATADFEVGGVTIRRGDNIGLMIGAANRDKRRWTDADELRLDRPDPRSISFGFGAHHCLGAALARLQLHITLPPLLDALGDYTIEPGRIVWKRSFALRGPTSLLLTPHASARHTDPDINIETGPPPI